MTRAVLAALWAVVSQVSLGEAQVAGPPPSVVVLNEAQQDLVVYVQTDPKEGKWVEHSIKSRGSIVLLLPGEEAQLKLITKGEHGKVTEARYRVRIKSRYRIEFDASAGHYRLFKIEL